MNLQPGTNYDPMARRDFDFFAMSSCEWEDLTRRWNSFIAPVLRDYRALAYAHRAHIWAWDQFYTRKAYLSDVLAKELQVDIMDKLTY